MRFQESLQNAKLLSLFEKAHLHLDRFAQGEESRRLYLTGSKFDSPAASTPMLGRQFAQTKQPLLVDTGKGNSKDTLIMTEKQNQYKLLQSGITVTFEEVQ